MNNQLNEAICEALSGVGQMNEAKEKDVQFIIDMLPSQKADTKAKEKKEYEAFAKKYNLKIVKIQHDGPGGGAAELTLKGKEKDALKAINSHNGENYKSFKDYEADYG